MTTSLHAYPRRAAETARLSPRSRAVGQRAEGAGRAACVPAPPDACVYCGGSWGDLEIRPGARAHRSCFEESDDADQAEMFASWAIPLPDPDVEYLQRAPRLPPRRANESSSTTARRNVA